MYNVILKQPIKKNCKTIYSQNHNELKWKTKKCSNNPKGRKKKDFLGNQKISKLTQDEKDNLISCITMKEIQFIVQNLPK